MSDDHAPDEHHVENFCDMCSVRIHVAAGALCLACAFDFNFDAHQEATS